MDGEAVAAAPAAPARSGARAGRRADHARRECGMWDQFGASYHRVVFTANQIRVAAHRRAAIGHPIGARSTSRWDCPAGVRGRQLLQVIQGPEPPRSIRLTRARRAPPPAIRAGPFRGWPRARDDLSTSTLRRFALFSHAGDRWRLTSMASPFLNSTAVCDAWRSIPIAQLLASRLIPGLPSASPTQRPLRLRQAGRLAFMSMLARIGIRSITSSSGG